MLKSRHFLIPVLLLAGLVAFAADEPGTDAWPQWGGSERDFTVAAGQLATTWPEDGPKELWRRELGEDGYSGIVAADGRLYTMYRQGEAEVVVAIDAATGETIWEKTAAVPLDPEKMMLNYGTGPMATPAIAGGRLFTSGALLDVHAFDLDKGEVVWSRDLVEEMGAPIMRRGHGTSPLVWQDLVILTPGCNPPDPDGDAEDGDAEDDDAEDGDAEDGDAEDGDAEDGDAEDGDAEDGDAEDGDAEDGDAEDGDADGAVIALRQSDGELAWKIAECFPPTYSSPILATVGGEEQVIVAMGPHRAGFDPRTGALRWHLELDGDAATTMSTQLWGDDQILFGSSAYADGSRGIKVSKKDGGTYAAEEIWYTRKMRVHHASAVRIGDHVYGSSGDFGPAFLTAVDVSTGELAFRQRGFTKANLLAAGDKVIVLDEDGNLAIGTPSPDGIEIHARAKVLERLAWTVPTLVGTRLYVRDRHQMKAFELGS